MFLKLVDADGRGGRLIGAVKSCRFDGRGDSPVAFIEHEDGKTETIRIEGDAFVMNDLGKTVDRFRQADRQEHRS